MDKYIKPKCTCGSVLVVRQEEIWRCTRHITKNGEVGNRIHIQTNWDEDLPNFTLSCLKCGKEYKGEYDNNERIVRGVEL